MSPLDFTGRRVLVTGGASGIGKAIAIKFLGLNATVIVLDKNLTLLEKLVQEYPSIQTVAADLQNWDDTRKAVEGVLPIHHLANNAGICPVMPFLDIDLSHINLQFDVNFKAALNVAQVVTKGMIASNISNGTIVNTSSIAGSHSHGTQQRCIEVSSIDSSAKQMELNYIGDSITAKATAVYSATKAALTMLTKSMAVELAPHGIRVNCVSPGLVNTELFASVPEEFLKTVGAFYDRLLFNVPTESEAVAYAIIVFLSSAMSSRITATRLVVDQGTTAQ